MNDKIQKIHLDRKALVYARQSTLKQLQNHKESTKRQYDLVNRAIALGWEKSRVIVIDEDLGQSGVSIEGRSGFRNMAEDVAHGRVGAIFALEVSRFARSSADWHRLLELCVLADVLIGDEHALYAPRDYNDRLLLGLKGTMSEAELYWMRLRLEGGRESKARRGELYFCPPAGYVWDPSVSRFRFDPGEDVQNAVKLIFSRFRSEGSAYGVSRYFDRMGLKIPSRHPHTRELIWIVPRQSQIFKMLHNPIYAGTYAFGRSECRMGLSDGKIKKRKVLRLAQESWKNVIHGHHPAYISWEDFLANQKKLKDNMVHDFYGENRGAAREGSALLQGLVICGRCGRRMSVEYQSSRTRRSIYVCKTNQTPAGLKCWDLSGTIVEQAVEEAFLEVVTDQEINLAFKVITEVQRQISDIDKQWKLNRERLEYTARLAERRYKAIDPDNRIVARTLEKEWEQAMLAIEKADHDYRELKKSEALELNEGDRIKLLRLANDLRQVWNSPEVTFAEKKTLLRILIREIALTPLDAPRRSTKIDIWWQSGATSSLTVPRKDKYTAIATPVDVVKKIQSLFELGFDDSQIADQLTQCNIPRRANKPWDQNAVQKVRYSYGFHGLNLKSSRRAPAVREDGLYSVRGVAEKLGVKPSLVHNWASTGLLPVIEGGGTTKPRWFRLDELTFEKLLAAKKARYEISRMSEEQN